MVVSYEIQYNLSGVPGHSCRLSAPSGPGWHLGVGVEGWENDLLGAGMETRAGARSGPCGDASGPENRLMTAERQTCWLAFGARRWHSSPEATVRLFPFLSKRLCPLVPPPTHLFSTAPHAPRQGHPVPWEHRRRPRALPKTCWLPLLPAPTLSRAWTPKDAPNVSASLPFSPLPSSSREAQATSSLEICLLRQGPLVLG